MKLVDRLHNSPDETTQSEFKLQHKQQNRQSEVAFCLVRSLHIRNQTRLMIKKTTR